MRTLLRLSPLLPSLCAASAALVTCSSPGAKDGPAARATPPLADPAQSVGSSDGDLEFFLYGSMSSEFIPERLLHAFFGAYPDLFPGGSLAAYGVIQDERSDLPLGFTRRTVAHLGSQPSIGINCAACHVGQVQERPDTPPLLVLGKPARFDIYSFSGAIAVALQRTAQPEALLEFLPHYLRAGGGDRESVKRLAAEIARRREAILEEAGAPVVATIGPGDLHEIGAEELDLDGRRLEAGTDLVSLARALLKLFQNMRTALHIPEELPGPVPTLPGPGRTDAFGVLAASFFSFPTRFEAPVKFGIVWDLPDRKWVHWDGNNDQPLARNLGAALGLGTPMTGGGRLVDFALVKRHTMISEAFRAPRWPWALDRASAARGARPYQAHCASCHDAPEDSRLFTPEDVGTDPNRARFFDARQAELLNGWVAALKVTGYAPPAASFRSTGKYVASPLQGVWARSPYLHNGSVRTLWDLVSPPSRRPRSFRAGSALFDSRDVGHADGGPFLFDCSLSGNSNAGHDYGTGLGEAEKRDLIEHLKAM